MFCPLVSVINRSGRLQN